MTEMVFINCSITIKSDKFASIEDARELFSIIQDTARKSSNETDGIVEVIENRSNWEIILRSRGISSKIYLSYVKDMCAKAISMVSDKKTEPSKDKSNVASMLGLTAGGKKLLRLFREGSDYLFFGETKDKNVRPLIHISCNY